MPMSFAEKKLVFSQFARFIVSVKNLIILLSQHCENKDQFIDLIDSVNSVIDEYYLNLSICNNCGHPVPIVPSIKLHAELGKFFDRYAELCEAKLGESLDDVNFYSGKNEILSSSQDKVKLSVPEELKSRVKKDNPKHFSGKLIKVGN